jgi:NAD(P)-dependent dehydrogenase (short-subunit alcohol dehydrogenase family)
MNRTKKKGQVMIITGATSGIGRATALEWAKHGGSVVLAARNSENLNEVALACEATGGKSLVVQVDVSREEEVLKLAEKAVNTYGKIDIWLNNAAVISSASLIRSQ